MLVRVLLFGFAWEVFCESDIGKVNAAAPPRSPRNICSRKPVHAPASASEQRLMRSQHRGLQLRPSQRGQEAGDDAI